MQDIEAGTILVEAQRRLSREHADFLQTLRWKKARQRAAYS